MIKLKDSISSKLLFSVIVIYLIVTFVITLMHMVINLEYQKEHIIQELHNIQKATKETMLTQLWEFNTKQLTISTQGLVQLPIVKAILLKDKKGQILIQHKDMTCKNCMDSSYYIQTPLYKKIFDNKIYLGEMIIYSSKDIALNRMKTDFSFIVFSSLIKSALLIILFILAFKRYLQKDLHHIVSQINTLDLNKKNQRISYDSEQDNELVILKNSVNQMLQKIDEQVDKLKENKALLQDKVDAQTYDLKVANEQLKEDIIQIKQHEAAIIQKTNFLDAMVANAPIPIFYKDLEGRYLGVNHTWEKMVGFTKKEILHKNVYDITPQEVAEVYARQDEKVFSLEENPQIYKSVIVHKNSKKRFDVMFYKSAFFDENNQVAGLIGSILDLTEINKLQDERIKQEKVLFEQAKMASMGEMIGNIAHQWRQPLSIISTFATGLELHRSMDMLNDEFLEEACQKINENAQYLSTTIDDFKAFIKGDECVIAFNIKDSIDSFKSLIQPMLKQYKIHLDITMDETLRIHGYPNQLIQCFMNLFNNSKDAFQSEEKYLFLTIYQEKNEIVFSFKDSAGGIQEEILPKIFEPYFTTKHKAQGTGLGLHMTYQLITEGMHGSIEVYNKNFEYEGKKLQGAEFIIKLPV